MTQSAKRSELRRTTGVWIVVGVLFLLSTVLLVRASGSYDLSWWTVDGGGVVAAGSGDYRLGGAAGQADASLLASGRYRLMGGFWGGVGVAARRTMIYLPVVVRRRI